jgi:acetyl esterase/lipase
MTSYRRLLDPAKGFTRLSLWLAFGLYLTSAKGARAEEPFTVRLWEGPAPGARGDMPDDVPTMSVHLARYPSAQSGAAAPDAACTAILVCPGGGYGGLAMGHEGTEIARWWNDHGISAAILNYRHRGKGYGHPAPLQDAQRALRTLRARAAEWKIDPQRIGVMGFSAGGHLASTLGTRFDDGNSEHADPVERTSCRPDFMILCYPVIAFGQPYTHVGSQHNLIGRDATDEQVRELSSERQVTAKCPPTFLFHTDEDQGVPAENSIALYLALRQAGVPAELHVYQRGPHGVGLAAQRPATASWPERCLDWLRINDLIPATPAP